MTAYQHGGNKTHSVHTQNEYFSNKMTIKTPEKIIWVNLFLFFCLIFTSLPVCAWSFPGFAVKPLRYFDSQSLSPKSKSYIQKMVTLIKNESQSPNENSAFTSTGLEKHAKTYSPEPMIELVGSCCLHLVLFLLPGIAVLLFARSRWSVPHSVCLMVIIIGSFVTGYIAFWIYFMSATVGRYYSVTVFAVSIMVCLRKINLNRLFSDHCVADVCWPIGIFFFSSMFYLSLGFLFGGFGNPIETAACRYIGPMPVDNVLPYWFANRIYNNQTLIPFTTFWQSSDRPPLQSAMVLMQMPLFFSKQYVLHYQIISTILQTTALAGIWSLLRISGLSRFNIAIALSSCIFTGFFIFNTFFVWPKLLAAGFVFMVFTLVFFCNPDDLKRNSILYGILTGCSAAFSLLAHGGSIFPLLTFVVMLIIRQVDIRGIWKTAAISFICLLLPWILYVKLYDPPGNQIIKIHLADSAFLEEKSVPSAVYQSYGLYSLEEITEKKTENLMALFGSPMITLREMSQGYSRCVNSLRTEQYLWLFPAIGLLNLGFLFLFPLAFRSHRSPKQSQAIWLYFQAGALTILWWCLIMFGPSTTSINHGSYFVPAILIIGFCLAISEMSQKFAFVICVLHMVLSLTIWAPRAINCAQQDSWNSVYPDPFMMALVIISGIGILTGAWMFGKNKKYDLSTE